MATFGLLSVLEVPEGRRPVDVYAQTLDLFAYGETLGFTDAWIAEHHFSDYGTLGGPPVFLAALASRTTHMRLGAGVSVLPFHDPLRVAEDYAALDVISGGRLNFGVGRGYQPMEFEGFGVPMGEARDRFKESLEVITRAWRGERFSFDGRFRTVPEIVVRPAPVQDPIPVYVASVSPQTFEIAIEKKWQIMGSLLTNSQSQLSKGMTEFRSRVGSEGGSLPILAPIYVADTMEQAISDSLEGVEWYLDTVGKLLPTDGKVLDKSYEYFAKVAERTRNVDVGATMAHWPIGTPEYVAEFLINLGRATTSTHFLFLPGLGGMELGKAKANIERIAEEVIPMVNRELSTAMTG